jgi:hypothetical protein
MSPDSPPALYTTTDHFGCSIGPLCWNGSHDWDVRSDGGGAKRTLSDSNDEATTGEAFGDATLDLGLPVLADGKEVLQGMSDLKRVGLVAGVDALFGGDFERLDDVE